MSRSKFKDEIFQKEFGVLLEGLRIRNPNSIYVYPALIFFRLLFALIPNFFKDRPALQFILLTQITLIYTAFFISCRAVLIFEDFVVEALNNVFFILMLYHLPVFMDGGLLNGTDVSISIDQYIIIQNWSATTFIGIGVTIIAINVFVLTKSITTGAIK